MGDKSQANRLIYESSPYLLQHAYNMVDWYPWGEEAFARARAEKKPIFLSIGYSACHWCHVMAHESFENEHIAALLNQNFVCIKVDREEHPDLDQIYQAAVYLLSRQGGWPLSVFLTPGLRPFFGGTYFPPEDRHGLTAFARVLLSVKQAYDEQQDRVAQLAAQVAAGIRSLQSFPDSGQDPNKATIAAASVQIRLAFDQEWGGFGAQPKFPQPAVLAFLLHYHRFHKVDFPRDIVAFTLRQMARGGIYDQIGGGFHRYSVDGHWLIPHFEKMLYDNALLLRVYLEAYQVSQEPLFLQMAQETAEYVRREMSHPEGGFYSSQDADSEGEEGKYYLWSKEEILRLLGAEKGEIWCQAFDVTEGGNFEQGKNVLHRGKSTAQICQDFNMDRDAVEQILQEGKEKLLLIRSQRKQPQRDEKIIVSWNALMISAFLHAYEILGDQSLLETATRSLEFLLNQVHLQGKLARVWKDGAARFPGSLEDYAFLTAALLDVFEITLENTRLEEAIALGEETMKQFWDEKDGGFFFMGRDRETVVTRPKSSQDNIFPSGSAVAVLNLLRLYPYTGREVYREHARKVFRLFRKEMEENPFNFAGMLSSLLFSLEPSREIVLVGQKDSLEMQAMRDKIRSLSLTRIAMYLTDPQQVTSGGVPPFARGKVQIESKATAYVCQNFACSLPLLDPEELGKLLAPGENE